MKAPLFALALIAAGCAQAADKYTIDPHHTFPSIEADHKGMSILRGKFTKNSGTVTLDRAAKTGSMEITIDAASVDFGVEHLNNMIRGEKLFDVAKFPTAVYKSSKITFNGDVPATVEGELTLHGVTKPVQLVIHKFKCAENAMLKREVCGADASAVFNRADFGLGYGVPHFDPVTRLQIEVEAIKD